MADAFNPGQYGEQSAALSNTYGRPPASASPETALGNSSMPSRRQMHPHRQTPSIRGPPSGYQVLPYGQMAPQEYVNTPLYSNMIPNDQVYGGPPSNFPPALSPYGIPSSNSQIYGGTFVDDQHQRHSMTSPDSAMPSHFSPPFSSVYSAGYNQGSLAPSNDKSRTQNESQYFGGQNPQNATFRMPTFMISPCISSNDDMIWPQKSKDQDYSPIRSTKAVDSTKDEASCIGTTSPDVNTDESVRGDLTLLRTIAQCAGELASLHNDDHSIQQSAYQQRGAQNPSDEQPLSEPETNQQQSVEDRSISTPYLSHDSMTFDSEREEEEVKEDLNKEGTDDEIQKLSGKPQSEDDIDKVDKYAFNFAREAYNHRVPLQLTNGITLHVNSLASMTTTLKLRREEMHDDLTPTLLPQPDEFKKGSKTVECIWIGMIPSPAAVLQIQSQLDQPSEEAGAEGDSKKPAKKRGPKKTYSVASIRDDEMKVIPFDQDALRVVAKKSDKITRDVHIYALLQPQNTSKLQGFKVGFDEVFYFRDFRNDTAARILSRKKATIAKIKASVFRNVAYAVSQSPAPTADDAVKQSHNTLTATSPISSLSSMATPTPPPGSLGTRKYGVARRSRKSSNDEVTHSASSFSQLVFNKESKNAESTQSRKRKAQDPLLDVLMHQREEARKESRTEGYYVPDSDSEVHESVEDDDQKSPADYDQNCDNLMDSDSANFADVDEPVDHASSAAGEASMDKSSQNDVDDEAFPEHAVRAHDPSFLKHMDDLIRQLAIGKSTASKGPQQVSFRLPNGQVFDKHGKAISSSSTEGEAHDSDDEGQSSRARSKISANLADEIKSLANNLARDQDIVGLQQAVTMMDCIQDRRGPPKTSALSLHFNVTNSKDIQIEDCSKQLEQLRALFPNLEDETKIQDHVLAWMTKGLQLTGQSLSIDILRHYLIAFAKLYDSKFGNGAQGEKNRIPLKLLVTITCSARDKAEETLRRGAIEQGADRSRSEAEGNCPSHPYIDLDEEVVYQPAIWECPEE